MTPGTNPLSTGLTVTGDLSAIGGSSAQVFEAAANNVFTWSAAVSLTTARGNRSLPITIADDQGRLGAMTIPLNVTAPLANSTIVISQIYGGGGNSNAVYRNDYVELYNRGGQTVDVTGWSLQYASATGSAWNNKQLLGGTIAPGEYYLVSLASGGTAGAPLPDANAVGGVAAINMSATTGKIALVDTFEELDGLCPLDTPNPHIKDFVGYGHYRDLPGRRRESAGPERHESAFPQRWRPARYRRQRQRLRHGRSQSTADGADRRDRTVCRRHRSALERRDRAPRRDHCRDVF